MNGYDSLGRPCKDLYLMNMAFEASKRSLDPNSKHGCIFTDADSAILRTGYNSPPIGSRDEKMPQVAPDKYIVFEHSERNAIALAAKRGIPLDNSHVHVTGLPCRECLRIMKQSGVVSVTYGPLMSKMIENIDYLEGYKYLLSPIYVENDTDFTISPLRDSYISALIDMQPQIKDYYKERVQIDIYRYVCDDCYKKSIQEQMKEKENV